MELAKDRVLGPFSPTFAVLGRRRVRISPGIEPFVGGQQPSLWSNYLARN